MDSSSERRFSPFCRIQPPKTKSGLAARSLSLPFVLSALLIKITDSQTLQLFVYVERANTRPISSESSGFGSSQPAIQRIALRIHSLHSKVNSSQPISFVPLAPVRPVAFVSAIVGSFVCRDLNPNENRSRQ